MVARPRRRRRRTPSRRCRWEPFGGGQSSASRLRAHKVGCGASATSSALQVAIRLELAVPPLRPACPARFASRSLHKASISELRATRATPPVRNACVKKNPPSQNTGGGPPASQPAIMATRSDRSATYGPRGLREGYDAAIHSAGTWGRGRSFLVLCEGLERLEVDGEGRGGLRVWPACPRRI